MQKSCNTDCTSYMPNKNNDNYINDQLTLEIKDIDDLAIAWIVDDSYNFYRIEEDIKPNLIDTKWLWKDGGKHGEGKVNITQWLHNNQNKLLKNEIYLVVAIYDFPYKKWISAGKWSFDASLILNGQTQWKHYDFGKSDTNNESYGYGLKYLKIIKVIIHNHKIILSETIQKSIISTIDKKVKEKYNYTDKNIENLIQSEYKELEKKDEEVKFTTYIPDFIFIIISFFSYYYLYNENNIFPIFIISNIIFLLYVFFRFRVAGKAWELVLRKKHSKELDSFMVVLGLLFTASLGAITSFDFDADNLINSQLYRITIFILYISTNIVFLYILAVISTYTINTLKANKPLMLMLVGLIGLGIFIQEIVNFEQNYKENISTVKICETNNATKR